MKRPTYTARRLWATVTTGTRTEIEWAHLAYSADNPFEVKLTVGAVKQSISRETLTAGMYAATGMGNVRVVPIPLATDPEDLVSVDIVVHVDGAEATVQLDYQSLCDFLDSTADVVPFDHESDHFDVDHLIEQLVGGVA